MKTQQAIVSESGWEAKPVNPYSFSMELRDYAQFDEANPSRPLTQYHTPGAKVTVREVWQYRSKDFMPWQLFPVENMDNYKGYADFQSYNASLLTQICFEVVSEEESKEAREIYELDPSLAMHIQTRKNSVEEAAENSLTPETFMEDVEIYHPEIYNEQTKSFINSSLKKYANAKINHIIQSGEYASKAETDNLYKNEIKYKMGLMKIWHKAFHYEASLIEIAKIIDEILDRKSNY